LKTAVPDHHHHLEVETKRVYQEYARKRRLRNNDDENIDLPSRMTFAHLLGHISRQRRRGCGLNMLPSLEE